MIAESMTFDFRKPMCWPRLAFMVRYPRIARKKKCKRRSSVELCQDQPIMVRGVDEVQQVDGLDIWSLGRGVSF